MSAAEPGLPAAPASRLEHFPPGLFGMAMGLFGFALASRAAGLETASVAIGAAAALALAGLLSAFGLKLLLHPAAMQADWRHPVRIAFFPAASISLLLLATFLRGHAPGAAEAVWILGAAAQGVLTLLVVSAWISRRDFGPMHLNPAWFIPAVGNVIVPLAGVPFGHAEVSWYFFSVGLLFWLALLTLVFNRLIFHDPLPERMQPTLVILIAPPAVASLAWIQLHGGVVDDMARALMNLGLFFTLLVGLQARALLRLPFAPPFWALSFPVAAMSTALLRFAALTGSAPHLWAGRALLALLACIIAVLAVRTAQAAAGRRLCAPE